MKTWAFLTYTIGGTLAVLFGTLGVGQLTSGSPLPALLAGLGILLLLAFPLWWSLRHAFSTPGPLRGGKSVPSWTDATPAIFARKFALVGCVLGAGLTSSVVVFAWFSATGPPAEALITLLLHLQLLFLVPAVTAILSATSLSQALSNAAGNSHERLKRINQVVLRGKDVALDEEEQIQAARVASVIPVSVPLQTYGLGFLLASSVAVFVRQALLGQGDLFAVFFLILLAVIVGILVPNMTRRLRRARRYATRNAGLL